MIKQLEDLRAKDKQRYEQHVQRLEAYIGELKGEVKQRDEEIERAIKVHRANERLSKEVGEAKSY